MQSVSSEYLTAITAATRRIVQSVQIEFVGNRILGDTITVTADEGDADAAPKGAVIDGKDSITRKYLVPSDTIMMEQDYSEPAGKAFYALYEYDGYLYTGNLEGAIYRKADGGTWSLAASVVGWPFKFLAFGAYLYVICLEGRIYRSADGTTWNLVFTSLTDNFYSFSAFDSYLYVGCLGGKIYRSADGTTWALAYTLTVFNIEALCVFGAYLYAGTGNDGKIYRSADGTTWDLACDLTPSTTHSIYSLYVFGGYIYAGCTSGRIYQSADGLTWTMLIDTSFGYLYAFGDFDGSLYTAGVTSTGCQFYRLADDETTWTLALEAPMSTGSTIRSLCPFGGLLYAATTNGKIYRIKYRMAPADDLYPLEDGIIWFGAKLSGDDRVIGTGGEAPTLTYNTATTIRSVRWTGDDWLGRPVDFVVEYWDGAAWVVIETVTDWGSNTWLKTLDAPVSTTKIRITVTKVNLPQTSAKLIEFEGGLAMEATELVGSWETLQERSADNMTNPLGNASSQQLTLELDNTGNLFYRKGGSVYAPYLVANRRILVQCGVELADGSDELVKVGTFYTVSWDADLDSPTARVVAWCRSKLLKETDFATSTVLVNQTISQLVTMLALDFGLGADEMVIDDTSDLINYAWFNKASYWSHLTALAAAEGGQVYFDEQDRLTFENRSHLADHATPVATLADTDTVIGVREGWEQSRMRNDVRVKPTALQAAASQEICNLTDELTVQAGGTLSVTLFFSSSPCIGVETPELTGGAHISISSWTAYAWGGTLVLANSGGADETVTLVTVQGQPLEASGGYEGAAEDTDLILLNGRRTYTVETPFIQSRAHAQALATGLLPVLSDPGAEITVSSRGRPELELADAVTVNVARMGIADVHQILRSRLVYDGGLAGELTLLEV